MSTKQPVTHAELKKFGTTLVGELEEQVKVILSTYTEAKIRELLDDWMEEVVNIINQHDAQIRELLNHAADTENTDAGPTNGP